MRLRLQNALLVTAERITEGSLLIERGRFVADKGQPATTLDLSGYALYPGLINAHDHLELNHYPRTKFREVYGNAHEWGEDVSPRLATSPFAELQSYPLWERCFVGGMKNLFSGVTTVAHHNPLHRPLKARWFPINVVRRYGWAHSLHFATPEAIQKAHRQSHPHPFMLHLAEGTDTIAQGEFARLQQLGVVDSRLVLIHGVGLSAADVQLAVECGASLVWCPSTNQYLLGQTANIGGWGKRVALGSDSRLTADGNLLDELRAAHATGQASPQQLLAMVTTQAAQLLRLSNVGGFGVGMQADVFAIPRSDKPYDALLNTRPADITLVICAGKILVADKQFALNYPTIAVEGVAKHIAPSIAKHLRKMTLPT